MEAFHASTIEDWASADVIVEAITAQNTVTAGYSDADITALDEAWMAEVGTSSTPTISPVLENPLAEFLREQVAASGGLITEVFVMDARGPQRRGVSRDVGLLAGRRGRSTAKPSW